MKKHQLSAEVRKIVGKKVKNLRKQGVLPASLYGKNVKSLSVQLPFKDFEKVYQEVGGSGVIELQLTGEEKNRPILIHNVQLNPLTNQPLHADFFQVDLKEKVTTMVPLEIMGEALAVKDKKGVLLHTIDEVEVEALPTDLPEKIETNVSSLSEVDQEVKVGDLKIPAGATILTDKELVVCKIGPLVTAEMKAEIKAEEEAAAVAAEAAAEVVPTEAAEVPVKEEKPAEGEKPSEEKSITS